MGVLGDGHSEGLTALHQVNEYWDRQRFGGQHLDALQDLDL